MSTATGRSAVPTTRATVADLAVFFVVCERWGLTTDQQLKLLGSPSRSTFFKWKKEGGSLSQDTCERISHIVSIYKALEILFTDPARSDGWVRRANAAFDNRGALDVMLGGAMRDLYEVRAYLDAQRGG